MVVFAVVLLAYGLDRVLLLVDYLCEYGRRWEVLTIVCPLESTMP